MIFFRKVLFIFIAKPEQEQQYKIKSYHHLLVYSPNYCNTQEWTSLKPEVQSPKCSSIRCQLWNEIHDTLAMT